MFLVIRELDSIVVFGIYALHVLKYEQLTLWLRCWAHDRKIACSISRPDGVLCP